MSAPHASPAAQQPLNAIVSPLPFPFSPSQGTFIGCNAPGVQPRSNPKTPHPTLSQPPRRPSPQAAMLRACSPGQTPRPLTLHCRNPHDAPLHRPPCSGRAAQVKPQDPSPYTVATPTTPLSTGRHAPGVPRSQRLPSSWPSPHPAPLNPTVPSPPQAATRGAYTAPSACYPIQTPRPLTLQG